MCSSARSRERNDWRICTLRVWICRSTWMASKPPTAIKASSPPKPTSKTSLVLDFAASSAGTMPSMSSSAMTSVYKNALWPENSVGGARCPVGTHAGHPVIEPGKQDARNRAIHQPVDRANDHFPGRAGVVKSRVNRAHHAKKITAVGRCSHVDEPDQE